jgi:hypothetical protein
MTYPYNAFPSYQEWETDSSVGGISPSTFRIYDPTLRMIDALVQHYHNPNHAAVQIESLFYLCNTCGHWLSKLNKTPANRGEVLDNITGGNLPTTMKVEGRAERRSAVSALRAIAGELLAQHTATGSIAEAMTALELVYGKASHGGTANNPGNDQHQIALAQNIGEVAIFLQLAHLQRRYKLRFRSGQAWRWKQGAGTNVLFDSSDNSESEGNDGKTHFVMNTRGHIFAGFDKTAFWFKHSSLIGGANVYSAGRIRIENGRVTLVENDSGHYHPGVQQMRNLMRRLQLYGHPINGVTVRRYTTNPRVDFSGSQIVATHANNWPDGVVG